MKEQETQREKRISGTGWSSEYLWANTWNRCQFVNLRQAFWKDLETRQQQCHIRVRQAKRSWSLLLLLFFKDWCDFQSRWSLSCSFSYMNQRILYTWTGRILTQKSFYYLGGLIEGTETLIFIIIILSPNLRHPSWL
mgnify:CR=1 FL=1